jgi:catechol 2,3-dioxygenase-like lactoylglutathione lyase family enzyme
LKISGTASIQFYSIIFDMRQKLNLITLGVDDFDRAINFYEHGLGWIKSSSSMEDLALFPLGGIVLALYPRKLLAEDAMIDPAGSGFPGITLSYNAKSEQEVDEVLVQVRSLGAIIIKPAQKASWGGYSGYFKDPEGYLFEVAYNPFWELDANDNILLR